MWPQVMPRDRRLPARVRVVEVGPRDGLQNISATVPTAVKVRFVDLLSAAGLPVIEVTSFVSPRAVPQLADAAEVFRAITKRPGTRYPVLVPNLRGMERALAAGVRDIAVFTAASEGFTHHNINATIDESLQSFRPVVELAQHEGIGVRGYVSTAFGCPYDGPVSPARVVDVTRRLFDLGVWEVSIGDTIGVATPGSVRAVLGALLDLFPAERLAVHFHDTRGTALANVLAALELGIATVDASAGGLGGCPYAPGASGNLATEDLLYMLHGMGIETGVDLAAVAAATHYLAAQLGITPAGKYAQSPGAAGSGRVS
jgi:isopropylmalate/homocitrate/citramalate synthase